jgi:hypothetical protein
MNRQNHNSSRPLNPRQVLYLGKPQDRTGSPILGDFELQLPPELRDFEIQFPPELRDVEIQFPPKLGG